MWEGSSVGFVLLSHTIRDALDHGIEEYRFLRGDDAYKSRFASENVPLVTLGLPNGVAGRTAVSAASLIQKVPPLRRTVRARLGA